VHGTDRRTSPRRRLLRGFLVCCGVALLWPIAAAAADDAASPMFSFGGFGTLGVVHSDQNHADFTSLPTEARGAGYPHSWSAAVDSLIGAQVTANLTPGLSAVLQIISQQNYDASFRPHVEWANIKYEFTPDFSMRIGRTTLGLFFVADSRNIGFANPWVRPPTELYSLISVTSNDGIGASYRHALGAASNTIQATAGHTDYNYPIPNSDAFGTANATQLLSLVDTYERGFAILRFTYAQAHVTLPTFSALFDAFRQFGPQGEAIADRYDVDDRIIDFLGLSANYEPGEWFLTGEWGRVNAHSVKFTPYATYAQVRANSHTSDPGLDVTALPPALIGQATALNAGLNASLATIASQRTTSAGARWDIRQSVDIKLQFDRTNLGPNSQGLLTNLQPGFRRGSSLDLINVTVDFVF
jgi:hypothetical protein